jgi:ABC-type transport system involved in multi-copper enzyme maturation permease subunit
MPWRETGALARHFFQGFFRLSFLDDAGEESFRRVIIGLLGGFVAFGLWLPRLFSQKYFYLSEHGRADVYLQALLADQLLMLCLPMFTVAMAMALVCHSLFPDETDYRILMALPISRAAIFAAKLIALLAFASIFIISTNVAIGIPFAAISTGPLNPHYWPVRAVAQVTAGLLGTIFAAGSVIALQGLVSIATPRGSLRSISVLMQTALVCALVLLLPLLVRVPTQGALLRSQPTWLYAVPPVWFMGLEETLLGSRDPYFVRLAQLAVVGTVAVALMAAFCYGFVYRRFDRVILRTEKRGRESFFRKLAMTSSITFFRARPEYEAVRAFTTATLRRSGLHQIVFLAVCAGGFSLAVNKLLGTTTGPYRWFVEAVLMAPLILMFAAVLGLRSALLLPVTRHAVWVFRLTEADERRGRELAVVEHLLLLYGVVIPIAIALPLEIGILGWHNALIAFPLTVTMGVLMTEVTLLRWHRIPFTCTYIPGKRPVVHTFLLLLVAFSFSTVAGTDWLYMAVTGNTPLPLLVVFLSGLAALFRWLRMQLGKNRPLEFEDELPESAYGLHLNT